MRTILLGGAAFSLLTVSAFGADLGTAPPVNPAPVLPPPFAWTSCYAGGHVGGSWASADMTDPAQLVQDSVLGAGSTTDIATATTTPTGFIGGGQIGLRLSVHLRLGGRHRRRCLGLDDDGQHNLSRCRWVTRAIAHS